MSKPAPVIINPDTFTRQLDIPKPRLSRIERAKLYAKPEGLMCGFCLFGKHQMCSGVCPCICRKIH